MTLACLFIVEVSLKTFYPLFDPTGKLTYSRNQDGVLLAQKNWVGRQWKNTGDYDVEVRINKYGLRDIRDLRQSTADDIFVVGDSFSMGHGVEEKARYSSLLDSMLEESVYNISIPTGLDGYDRLLSYAVKQGATVANLIIGVCMENDLGYYTAAAENQQNPPVNFYAPASEITALARFRFYLSKYSATYAAIAAVAHQNVFLRQMAVATGFIVPNFSGMPRQKFSTKLIRSTAQRLKRLVTDHNIAEAIILIIPSRALWTGGNEVEQSKIHDQFIQELERLDLNKIVDMRPHFEDFGDPLSFHFNNDGHWNDKGHAKTAKIIHQSINEGAFAK